MGANPSTDFEVLASTVMDVGDAGRRPDVHRVSRAGGHSRFMPVAAWANLPVPWPRCQDIQEDLFKEPCSDDLVLAVSHSWPAQTHPDPTGEKAAKVNELVRQAAAVHEPLGDCVGFFDFLSVPQNPFARGQAPRTDAQSKVLSAALASIHWVYLNADAVLHLDFLADPVPGEGDLIRMDARDLCQCSFKQVQERVQIVDVGSHSDDALFGYVVEVDEHVVTSLDALRSYLETASDTAVAVIRRAPFGLTNSVPCSSRGWIFLERFCSMVKVAMVPEAEACRVVFSNSDSVLHEIIDGGARLRRAAQGSSDDLSGVLQTCFSQLDEKSFFSSSDRNIVMETMRELAATLPKHWACQGRL